LCSVNKCYHVLPDSLDTMIFSEHKPLERFLVDGGSEDRLLEQWSWLMSDIPLTIVWIAGK